MDSELKLTTEEIFDLMKESNINNMKRRAFLIKFIETKKAAESWMSVYNVKSKTSAYSASSRVLNYPEVKAFLLAYEIASTRVLRKEISPIELIRAQYKLAMDPSDDKEQLAKGAREFLLNWMGASSIDFNLFLYNYEEEKREELRLALEKGKEEDSKKAR